MSRKTRLVHALSAVALFLATIACIVVAAQEAWLFFLVLFAIRLGQLTGDQIALALGFCSSEHLSRSEKAEGGSETRLAKARRVARSVLGLGT